MSGIEVTGAFLGALPFLVSIIQGYGDGVYFITQRSAKYRWRLLQYGHFKTWILYTFFFDAFAIMDRVESHIRKADEKHVIAFIQSQTSSFNMIGIAASIRTALHSHHVLILRDQGAIIAQVAISAMSLTNIADSHWTAHAFFIVSLVTGSLSVFFSCAISLLINGLHSSDDIKDFVFLPSSRRMGYRIEKAIERRKKGQNIESAEFTKLISLLDGDNRSVASPYAAVMIVVPRSLLNVALNAFLMGLGIYLGKLYTAKLVPEYGLGSVGILTFYLVSALCGIAMYSIPQSLHSRETSKVEKWHEILADYAKESTETSRQSRNAKQKHAAAEEATALPPAATSYPSGENLGSSHDSNTSLDVIEELMRPRIITTRQELTHVSEPNNTIPKAPSTLSSTPTSSSSNNAHEPNTPSPPSGEEHFEQLPQPQTSQPPNTPSDLGAVSPIEHASPLADSATREKCKDTERPSETKHSPFPLPSIVHDDIPDILRDLIRIQEESARLNRRLLAVLSSAGEHQIDL